MYSSLLSGPVRRACKRFGFRVADEGSEAVLYWSDCSVSIDRAAELKPYQVGEDMLRVQHSTLHSAFIYDMSSEMYNILEWLCMY